MRAARLVDEDFRQMSGDAWWKVISIIWFLMVFSAIIMVSVAVSIGRENNRKLRDASIRFDEAFQFDFDAFATTACRTCDGTELIIRDGTPIVVQPFLNGNLRQFPEGIRIPCFSSGSNRKFTIRADTMMISPEGLTVDARTVLGNPQGMRSSDIMVNCMGAAPCLPSSDFCTDEFGMDFPHGPIYRFTRTNVGSGMVTLEHLCVCILDWDPVSETSVTLPYCTEPLTSL